MESLHALMRHEKQTQQQLTINRSLRAIAAYAFSPKRQCSTCDSESCSAEFCLLDEFGAACDFR